MNYHLFHWVWYLLGFMFVPRLTIAIALSIYGKELGLPLWLMILIWVIVLLLRIESKDK